MPNEAFAWLTRVKAVEREHTSTRLAIDRLKRQAQDDPTILLGDLRPRDIGAAAERLDGTYIIRLFAEFETALRHFMRESGYAVPRSAEPLINRVRDRARIPNDDALNAHTVRDYRNTLVHDRREPVDPIPIREATRRLCIFLGWLQRLW
jgi:hypothetical protein